MNTALRPRADSNRRAAPLLATLLFAAASLLPRPAIAAADGLILSVSPLYSLPLTAEAGVFSPLSLGGQVSATRCVIPPAGRGVRVLGAFWELGRVLSFRAGDTGGGMVSTGTYTIDSVSLSGNSRTFQIHYVYASINHNYVLARVTDGTSYASNYTTMLPYPTLVDTGGPGYMTATLQ